MRAVLVLVTALAAATEAAAQSPPPPDDAPAPQPQMPPPADAPQSSPPVLVPSTPSARAPTNNSPKVATPDCGVGPYLHPSILIGGSDGPGFAPSPFIFRAGAGLHRRL